MTIHITLPPALAPWHLRRLLAIIGVFAPDAVVRVGSHVERTLPNQMGVLEFRPAMEEVKK